MYKYDEIKRQVLNDLCSMPPHTRIRSRKALCIKYGVTRTTVDRAIDELIKEKYLYTKPGSGTYVSDLLENKKDISYWGVVLPNVVKEVYPDMLSGIERFASAHDINIIISSSDNNWETEYSNIARLSQSNLNGFIITPCITDTVDYHSYQLLQKQKIPFVFCNRLVEGIRMPFVSSNSYYGGYIATKRLIATGAKRIAFVSEFRYKSSMQRFSGFCSAMVESGLTLEEDLILLSYEDAEQVRAMLTRRRPEAIFAFNDTVASVIYSILIDMKVTIGKEISLIGYDNSSICDALPVKLTSVSYMAQEIGYCAADILYKMQMEKSYPALDVHLFQPYVVERGSCLPVL